MVQMIKNAANLTNELLMKREHDVWVPYLHNTHCRCFSPASVQSTNFPSNVYSLSTFVLHFTEMSIRMLANRYKHLTTITKFNALPTIRMACNLLQICCEWLQICCEYAFLANSRSMFVTPQNRARMLTKVNECYIFAIAL